MATQIIYVAAELDGSAYENEKAYPSFTAALRGIGVNDDEVSILMVGNQIYVGKEFRIDELLLEVSDD